MKKKAYNTLVMERIVREIHKLLIKKRKTVAVAESCSGGLLSTYLTSLSGSSWYFILGVIAYSNRSKSNILKIPAQRIVKKGAVSAEVALQMAQQVRKLAHTDFGIGITGIAGPTGGSIQKPIGTVFIAIASKNNSFCKKFCFKGTRAVIRKQAAFKAIALLKQRV